MCLKKTHQNLKYYRKTKQFLNYLLDIDSILLFLCDLHYFKFWYGCSRFFKIKKITMHYYVILIFYKSQSLYVLRRPENLTIVKLLWPSQKENFNFTLFQLASVVLKSHKLHVYILPLFVNCVVCFSNLCDFMSSLVGNSTTHISHENFGNWSWCSLSKWTSNAAHSDQKFSYFRVLKVS